MRPETTEKSDEGRYNQIMVFYIDVFLFVNFLCDFLILFSAGRLGGVKFSGLKTSLGAAAGALYAAAAVLWEAASSFPARLFASVTITLLSYGYRSRKAFFKQYVLFILCSAAAGGAAFAAAVLTGGWAWGGLIYFDKPFFYTAAGILSLVVSAVVTAAKIRSENMLSFYGISVIKSGEVYRLHAAYDSANRCIDPVTALPVIISEDIFSEKIKNEAREINFKTASGTGKILIFVPDRIIISNKELDYVLDSAVIGITDQTLSCDKSFNALIGGACFEQIKRKNNRNYKSFIKRG